MEKVAANWIDMVLGLVVVYGIIAVIIKAIPPVKEKNKLLKIIKFLDKIVTRKRALTK